MMSGAIYIVLPRHLFASNDALDKQEAEVSQMSEGQELSPACCQGIHMKPLRHLIKPSQLAA